MQSRRGKERNQGGGWGPTDIERKARESMGLKPIGNAERNREVLLKLEHGGCRAAGILENRHSLYRNIGA
jgi:hypothetical protein